MSARELPDRHIPLRTPVKEANCVFRTSLSPESLSPRERYNRERDTGIDPLYAPTKRRPKARQRVTANGNGMPAPHYVPSFVHMADNNPSPVPHQAGRNVRYFSIGSAWAVGGRVAAIPTQLPGIDTGTGEILASGTTAPMIDAAFTECVTTDDKSKAYEARLALALDIEQTHRVLPISPPTSPRSDTS